MPQKQLQVAYLYLIQMDIPGESTAEPLGSTNIVNNQSTSPINVNALFGWLPGWMAG